jgi:hypothetical protein
MGYNSTQHNRKNCPRLLYTLAHRRDHIQKDWTHDNASTIVSVETTFLSLDEDHIGRSKYVV